VREGFSRVNDARLNASRDTDLRTESVRSIVVSWYLLSAALLSLT
jgi:hypothetical protein